MKIKKRKREYKNINIEKGGLYRVSARIHTNYTGAAGNKHMCMYEYRNANNHSWFNYQSSNSTGYECHMFDEICSFKKADYFNFYDGNYGTNNDHTWQRVQVQYIPFAHTIGHWRTNAIKDTYIRVWDYEYWCNEMLYELSDDKTRINVKENGNYRISAHLCNNQPSGNGHSSFFINDEEYCLSRMGSYSTTTW
eukprot:272674_1